MYETRTKYIQDTYMNVNKTITIRFTPFPKPRDRAEKNIKMQMSVFKHVKWYKI